MPHLKLRLSRSCTSSSAFCLSRIARYAPSPAKPNMRHICDPCVNIFCGMGSKVSDAKLPIPALSAPISVHNFNPAKIVLYIWNSSIRS